MRTRSATNVPTVSKPSSSSWLRRAPTPPAPRWATNRLLKIPPSGALLVYYFHRAYPCGAGGADLGPDRPQRGPYTGRGARTGGLVGDRTRVTTPSPRPPVPAGSLVGSDSASPGIHSSVFPPPVSPRSPSPDACGPDDPT